MNELIKNIVSGIKKYWFLPVLALLGIVLLTEQFNKPEAVAVASTITDQHFIAETETRIVEMLKNVSGAGECSVTITLASGGKKEYVREDGNVLVIADKEGNEVAVVSRESVPEIAGVTVVSTGAGSVAVRNEIIKSVSTVLGIGTNKICVVSMSG